MYSIKFANDSLMPAGQDYVLCSQHDGDTVIYYRDSLRAAPERFAQVLEDSWGAYRVLTSRGAPASV